jgi:putative DNA primase/helicase
MVNLLTYPFTDSGNAERLAALHNTTLRYCVPWRAWLTWDDARWARDATGEVMRLAKQTVRAFHQQAFRIADETQRTAALKWAIRSESAPALLNMVRLAQAHSPLPVVPADLDSDPWLLNCLNGTLDLRTGTLRPHDRADLITKLAPVAYDATAEHETWTRFLHDATDGDVGLQRFLQRAAGYTLLGRASEEVFFLIHGEGATGKSTFVSAVQKTLGDYAMTADFEAFLAKRGDAGIRNDIARLAGARLVVSIEVDEGRRLAEGLVKTLTGGDTIAARFLYGEFFEFVPQFTLVLACNHAPRVNAQDAALWRRIARIPFVHVVPPEDRDPTVKATLTDPTVAGATILRWAVDGCRAYLADGLGIPPAVSASTTAYRKESDALADFVSEHCVLDPASWESTKALRSTYADWVKETSARRPHPLSAKAFAEHLKQHGCEPTKQDHVRGWLGIRLRTDADDEHEDAPGDGSSENDPSPRINPLSDSLRESYRNGRPHPSHPSPVDTSESCERQAAQDVDPEAEPCGLCGVVAVTVSAAGEPRCADCFDEWVRDP